MEHNPIANLITVSVSNDKLSAHMSLNAREKVSPCSVEQLVSVLHAHGVKFGILEDQLARFAASPGDYASQSLLVAIGEPPQEGQDGTIQYLFQDRNESQKPQVLEDGRVDFKDVLKINNVKKGQVIAERLPAHEGAPGIAVTGENLPPKKVREAHFKLGKNVVADDERTRIYAVIDGLVTFTDNNKVNVFPVYEVHGDVDYRSGNIEFVGNVVVRGNVISGFKVKAEGDVRITGSVEGAEVVASGSIDIAEGIIAHNKGFVKAGKTIKCSFIQDAQVEAGEDVIVNQSIMHSITRAGRSVICNGSKGLIVGGTVQAGESVIARTVGNMTFTPTSIEAGIMPQLRNELNESYQNLKTLSDNLDKTEKGLKILEQMVQIGPLPEDKQLLLNKFRQTKRQLLEQQTTLGERIEELEDILENTESARIEVNGTIYGGSKIVIGRYTRFIKDATQRVIFRYDNGEVVMNAKF